MSFNERRVPLRGSERQPLPGARAVGPVDPNEEIRVSLFLRRRPDSAGPAAAPLAGGAITDRQYLTHE
jgi:hypothetical protein